MDSVIDSDEQLMLRYAEGDVQAFEMLYTKHKAPVYRYMMRLCQNEAIAEEIFQEVWMKLINARNKYVVSAKFTTYLYKLAHNCFIDHFRKQNVRVVTEQTEESIELAIKTDGPEQQFQMEQTLEKFNLAFDALPQEQREVLLLKEEAGMSLQDIAETIGVNYETAKSRLRYALNRLKMSLDES